MIEENGSRSVIIASGPMPQTEDKSIGPALIEKWALGYLERFASSAENLRRVLGRRARRRMSDPEGLREARALIDALVARYRDSGLIDDAAYASARARGRLARGEPLRKIAAGLAAKGVDADDRAAALAGLHETIPDPDLAAARPTSSRATAGASSRFSRAPGLAGARPRRCCVASTPKPLRRCSPPPNSAPRWPARARPSAVRRRASPGRRGASMPR